jgi:hypothetical protein
MQHAEHPDLLCNIHMIQLQYTSETFKTIETYSCNIRREREPDAESTMSTGPAGAPGVEAGTRARAGSRPSPHRS